jgi:acetyltransferase-like isoleucine patch superfamily enzyme
MKDALYYGSRSERHRLQRAVRKKGGALLSPLRMPHPPGRKVSEQITIGERTVIGPGLWLSMPNAKGRLSIGSDCFFGGDVSITCAERVVIGDGVGIADRCGIFDHGHDPAAWHGRTLEGADPRKGWGITTPRPVELKRGALLAVGVLVMPGVTIGEGALVAPGAVVTEDVEDFTMVAGNPARLVRRLRD